VLCFLSGVVCTGPFEAVVRRFHRWCFVYRDRPGVAKDAARRRGGVSGPYHPIDVDIHILLRLAYAAILLWRVPVDISGNDTPERAAVCMAVLQVLAVLSHTISAFFRGNPASGARSVVLALVAWLDTVFSFAAVHRILSRPFFHQFGTRDSMLSGWEAFRFSAAAAIDWGARGTGAWVSTLSVVQAGIGVLFLSLVIAGAVSRVKDK
jgi:hypothetical protein